MQPEMSESNLNISGWFLLPFEKLYLQFITLDPGIKKNHLIPRRSTNEYHTQLPCVFIILQTPPTIEICSFSILNYNKYIHLHTQVLKKKTKKREARHMGAPASRHGRPAPTDFHPRSGFATPPSPSLPGHAIRSTRRILSCGSLHPARHPAGTRHSRHSRLCWTGGSSAFCKSETSCCIQSPGDLGQVTQSLRPDELAAQNQNHW